MTFKNGTSKLATYDRQRHVHMTSYDRPDQRQLAGLGELYKRAASPVFPVRSLTLQMTSSCSFRRNRHGNMTSYDGQTSVIRRVSVSATNVPNFATILKGVCEWRP
ncbi:hypothetical protein DPMN_089313 [Dreissena polymorpha]|uniref:Uncharacterized protein n=1 Tax=Dreissena polymorpha TaxID=45954 RepID=A0A9D4KY05_DREPO|nr:hypothetical protein DPMN_089313 [Dreissena polymorpha]